MSMAEMIAKFEITDIHKSGAVLDPIKLDWMNGEYIKRMELRELHTKLSKYLETYEPDFYKNIFSVRDYTFNEKIIRELQTRMKRFDEYISLTPSLYGDAKIRKDLLVNPKMKIESESEALDSIKWVREYIESADYTSLENLKTSILEAILHSGKKNGQILWPLRIALS